MLSSVLRESQLEFERESELRSLRDHSAWIWSDLVDTYSAHEHSSMAIEALAEQRNACSGVKTRPSGISDSFSQRYSSTVANLQSVYETLDELYAPSYAARFDLETLKQKAADVNSRLLDIRVGLQKQIEVDRKYLNSLESGRSWSSTGGNNSDRSTNPRDSGYAESVSSRSQGTHSQDQPEWGEGTSGKDLKLKNVEIRLEDHKQQKTEFLDMCYDRGALYRLTRDGKPVRSFVFVLKAYIGSQEVKVALDLTDVVEGAYLGKIARIPTRWSVQTEAAGTWLIKLWDSNKAESWPLLRLNACDGDRQAQRDPRIVLEKLDHELCKRITATPSFEDA